MFDAVPFAGAGRMVGDGDRQPGLSGEALQFAFPEAHARAIAAFRQALALDPGLASAQQGLAESTAKVRNP